MKNILSYRNPIFTGREIKDWIIENMESSHMNIAKYLYEKYYNKIKDDALYCVYTNHAGTSCGEIVKRPIIKRCMRQ